MRRNSYDLLHANREFGSATRSSWESSASCSFARASSSSVRSMRAWWRVRNSASKSNSFETYVALVPTSLAPSLRLPNQSSELSASYTSSFLGVGEQTSGVNSSHIEETARGILDQRNGRKNHTQYESSGCIWFEGPKYVRVLLGRDRI